MNFIFIIIGMPHESNQRKAIREPVQYPPKRN